MSTLTSHEGGGGGGRGPAQLPELTESTQPHPSILSSGPAEDQDAKSPWFWDQKEPLSILERFLVCSKARPPTLAESKQPRELGGHGPGLTVAACGGEKQRQVGNGPDPFPSLTPGVSDFLSVC